MNERDALQKALSHGHACMVLERAIARMTPAELERVSRNTCHRCGCQVVWIDNRLRLCPNEFRKMDTVLDTLDMFLGRAVGSWRCAHRDNPDSCVYCAYERAQEGPSAELLTDLRQQVAALEKERDLWQSRATSKDDPYGNLRALFAGIEGLQKDDETKKAWARALCEMVPKPKPTALSAEALADRARAISNATHGNYNAEILVRRLEEEGWTITEKKSV